MFCRALFKTVDFNLCVLYQQSVRLGQTFNVILLSDKSVEFLFRGLKEISKNLCHFLINSTGQFIINNSGSLFKVRCVTTDYFLLCKNL